MNVETPLTSDIHGSHSRQVRSPGAEGDNHSYDGVDVYFSSSEMKRIKKNNNTENTLFIF